MTSILISGEINSDGNAQITATYDKVSHGFVNIGYFFPQLSIDQSQINTIFNQVTDKLIQYGDFGNVEINVFIDNDYNIYLDKIQCYQTQVSSSLFYFKFLCAGNFNTKGQYITKIV